MQKYLQVYSLAPQCKSVAPLRTLKVSLKYQICTPKSTNFFKRKQPSWVLTKGIHSPFGNHGTFQVLTIGEPLTRYQVLRQSTKYPKVPKYWPRESICLHPPLAALANPKAERAAGVDRPFKAHLHGCHHLHHRRHYDRHHNHQNYDDQQHTGEKREQRKSWVSGWHLMFSNGIQDMLCWDTWWTIIFHHPWWWGWWWWWW